MTDYMDIYTTCPYCGKVTTIKVPTVGYFNWAYGGMLIQQAMPELSANEREALISGICSKCWGSIFSCDDEDDD